MGPVEQSRPCPTWTPNAPAEGTTLAALASLYENGYHRYLRVAEAIVGDAEIAHDAVQDAFARAIRGRSGYRGSGSVEGWLWRTVVNAAKTARRDAPPPHLPLDEVGDGLPARGTDGSHGELGSLVAVAARTSAARPLPSLLRRSRLPADRGHTRDQPGNGRRDAEPGARSTQAATRGRAGMSERDLVAVGMDALVPLRLERTPAWDDVLARAGLRPAVTNRSPVRAAATSRQAARARPCDRCRDARRSRRLLRRLSATMCSEGSARGSAELRASPRRRRSRTHSHDGTARRTRRSRRTRRLRLLDTQTRPRASRSPPRLSRRRVALSEARADRRSRARRGQPVRDAPRAATLARTCSGRIDGVLPDRRRSRRRRLRFRRRHRSLDARHTCDRWHADGAGSQQRLPSAPCRAERPDL